MSSASHQKLVCGVCSASKCTFDEFVGEKVVSPSYSSGNSAMLSMWKFNSKSSMQSELSHKEESQYWILMHIHGFQKDGSDEPICRAAVELQT